MPRKLLTDRPTRLHISLPESSRAWLDEHLWSSLEDRVPQGAYQEWFLARLAEYRDWEELSLEPFGFPPGFAIRGPRVVCDELRRRLTETQK